MLILKKIIDFFYLLFNSPNISTLAPSLPDNETTAKIIQNEWLQGHIFPTETHSHIEKLLGKSLGDTDFCIVITQSCNIIYHDYDKEPNIEVLIASKIHVEMDGNCTGSKNPRELHFYITDENGNFPCKTFAKEKYYLPRQILANFKPSTHKIADIKMLVAWLASRYDRIAFPDKFNERIPSKIKSRLKKGFSKLSDVSHVFISLTSWEELEDDNNYGVALVFIMPVSKYQDANLRANVQQIIDAFIVDLESCVGIDVNECQMVSEDEFTLNDVRQMKLWNDYNYFSNSDLDTHAAPIAH